MTKFLSDRYSWRLDDLHRGPSLLPEPAIPPVPPLRLHSRRPLGIRPNHPRLEVIPARATQQTIRPPLLLC